MSRNSAVFAVVAVVVAVIVGVLGQSLAAPPWQLVRQGIRYDGPLAQDVACAFMVSCPPCPSTYVGQCYVLTVDLVLFRGNCYYLFSFTGTYDGVTKSFNTLFTNSTIYCTYPTEVRGTGQVCPIE